MSSTVASGKFVGLFSSGTSPQDLLDNPIELIFAYQTLRGLDTGHSSAPIGFLVEQRRQST